jgi:hypothetical protein
MNPEPPVHLPRRLFVGDLHGCLAELDALLAEFAFRPGQDCLYSVGDVVGKGPHVAGTLRRLKELGARAVLGNHDHALLKAVRQIQAGEKPRYPDYPPMLGSEREEWFAYISAWPAYLEMGDIILVHAGLEPGKTDLAAMNARLLREIRTWDGQGQELNRAGDPPWYACVRPGKTVVFGHWSKKGLVDLPGFKGLDTGCVYGGKLTGWCPEEDRFLQVPAARAYAPIHLHPDKA